MIRSPFVPVLSLNELDVFWIGHSIFGRFYGFSCSLSPSLASPRSRSAAGAPSRTVAPVRGRGAGEPRRRATAAGTAASPSQRGRLLSLLRDDFRRLARVWSGCAPPKSRLGEIRKSPNHSERMARRHVGPLHGRLTRKEEHFQSRAPPDTDCLPVTRPDVSR